VILPRLALYNESFAIRGLFRLSRGAKKTAETVRVEVSQDGCVGRGEAVPYRHYGETVDGVMAQIEGRRALIESGTGRQALQSLFPAGAARNALDCALWDLESALNGQSVWQRAGLPPPHSVITTYTLSLDSPSAMARVAAEQAWPILKLKLGDEADLERVQAVRQAAPGSRLVVDANEAWSLAQLLALAPPMAKLGVELIEQPLPAGFDESLRGLDLPVALAADESFHTAEDLPGLAGLFQTVNIKLDKTGGFTAGLAALNEAHKLGFEIMVGCMVATSLSMAPALLLAQKAKYVDLDGPLLLERDRSPGLHYEGARVYPPDQALWGNSPR